MNFQDYFNPVVTEADYPLGEEKSLGSFIKKHLPGKEIPDLNGTDIAIIGISEYRGSTEPNSDEPANLARKCLYELAININSPKIADLGNLKSGKSLTDSYAALRDTISELLNKNVVPVILGGSSDITGSIFEAYEKKRQSVNITSIDKNLGVSGYFYHGTEVKPLLKRAEESDTKYLFNYSVIGYQSHFTTEIEMARMDSLLFDFYRLGKIRENLMDTEPVIRDSDMVLFSMSSVKQADAPAVINPSPNGFTGEDACQLAWYSGKSSRVTSFAIFDWHSLKDIRLHTAHQVAQIAWYFIDGFYKREGEYPFTGSKNCTKFIVNLSDDGSEVIFYKSNLTSRWWMEVPSNKFPRSLLVACSYNDYLNACNQDIPERWWQNYKKINR